MHQFIPHEGLNAIRCRILSLRFSEPLFAGRVRVGKPGGTAGGPSKQKTYAWYIVNGKSPPIALSSVQSMRDRLKAGRELQRLELNLKKLTQQKTPAIH